MDYIFAKSYSHYYLKVMDYFTFLLMRIWKKANYWLMLKEKILPTSLKGVVYLVKFSLHITYVLQRISAVEINFTDLPQNDLPFFYDYG